MRLLVLLAAPLSILVLHIAVAAQAGSMAPGRLERWVRSGLQSLQWDQLDRCLRMSSLSEAECRRLAHLPLSAVAVYVSEPRAVAGREGKGHTALGFLFVVCLFFNPELGFGVVYSSWCGKMWRYPLRKYSVQPDHVQFLSVKQFQDVFKCQCWRGKYNEINILIIKKWRRGKINLLPLK